MCSLTDPSLLDDGVLPDSIAEAALSLFGSLDRNGKPEFPKYTILAAIVAVVGRTVIKVLSLATGTKCAGNNIISANRHILVDSHAEVLARRAFLRYLYKCIQRCLADAAFMECDECPLHTADGSGRFALKANWRLYLYSSDSPCGDSAVYERTNGRSFSGKKARLCNSLDVSGTMQAVPGAVRLKPGRHDIPDHCRTSSMSCSDKIAKWNYLGIQGALLSYLLSPIYLSGVVVGVDPLALPMAQLNALKRALVDRLPNAPDCQMRVTICTAVFPQGKCYSEYALSEHANVVADHRDSSQDTKIVIALQPFELSINWLLSIEHALHSEKASRAGGTVEITLARTGIPQGSSLGQGKGHRCARAGAGKCRGFSRLCSSSLYELFCDTLSVLGEAAAGEILNCGPYPFSNESHSFECPPTESGKHAGDFDSICDQGVNFSVQSTESTCHRKKIAELIQQMHAPYWWKCLNLTYALKKSIFLTRDPFNSWVVKNYSAAEG